MCWLNTPLFIPFDGQMMFDPKLPWINPGLALSIMANSEASAKPAKMFRTMVFPYISYRMVPPSDVCWFINPINYSYICHKP